MVNRSRLGLYVADDGHYFSNLRHLQPRADAPHMANWKLKHFPELQQLLCVDPARELRRLGAVEVGSREDVTGEAGKTRGWPCVKFKPDDLLTPLGAYVLVALQALYNSYD